MVKNKNKRRIKMRLGSKTNCVQVFPSISKIDKL